MKGLGDNRARHLSENLDSPQDSLYAAQDRNPFLLNPSDSYTMDTRFPTTNSMLGECILPLNNQISNSSTFPRIHYNSHFEVPPENPFPTLTTPAAKINRLPANLLDQFEKQLPIHRDGFSTLQFQRGEAKHRSESPGRIKHLVTSVQKLFAKSQSLEGNAKAAINGKKGPDDPKGTRRSKSKDRAKTETKRRARTNISGWWSSDDNLDSDTCNYRNPMGMMTLGRQPDHSQPRYFMHNYNTISESMLKASKSNNDLKVAPCTNIPINSTDSSSYIKRGSWSTLTLSHAREVCQKASATIDKALLKSKSCHQDMTYQYLQVPVGDWNNTLIQDSEIPCRRMRSGSYIKAMGDDDSEDSEGSPKPSPKTAARRQSYLKATQQSLGEQSTTHRSLDHMDSVEIMLPPKFQSWEEEYSPIPESINESSSIDQYIPQVREIDLSDQYELPCESTFSEPESVTNDVLDLPLPNFFRSRSHSYLRAIQAGCSQEDDVTSVQSMSPPLAINLSRTLQQNMAFLGVLEEESRDFSDSDAFLQTSCVLHR